MNLGDQRKGIGISFLTQILLIRPEVGWEECISPLSLHALMKSKGNCKSAVLPFHNGKQIP